MKAVGKLVNWSRRGRSLVVWALLAASTPAMAAYECGSGTGGKSPAAGDEDPFPLRCVNFTGQWRSDGGERYDIRQHHCDYLRMQAIYGSEVETISVVPDNKFRPGPIRGSMVRHRWNSPQMGTVLETHRSYTTMGNGQRITEVTMFERANDNLLLETTYRVIEDLNAPGQPPRRDYEQNVYRKESTGGGDGGSSGDEPINYTPRKGKRKR